MRVLLTSIGSSGDINPFIALGKELVRRGHDAALLVNPYFEPGVRGAGLRFEALGEYFSPTELAREVPATFARFRGPWVLIRGYLVPIAAEMYRAGLLAARHFKPDVIVCHQISLGIPWAVRKLGIPYVTTVLAPATVLSAHSPAVYQTGIDVTRTPLWHRRFYSWQSRRTVSFILDGALNKVRRELGLPRCNDTLFGEMLGGAAVLGMWSPTFRGTMPDDPPNLTICGFPWHDTSAIHGERGERLDERVERFLREGDAPVVFTLGSVLAHQAEREFSIASRACAILGRRGILLTGSEGAAPSDVSEKILCVDYAPFGQLLHRGAMTVHHGGVGTTAQALRARRPMIVTPYAHDQFDNAARAQRLGVGRWLPRRRFTPKGLAKTITAVLSDAGIREKAESVGATIEQETGVATAANVLETVSRGG